MLILAPPAVLPLVALELVQVESAPQDQHQVVRRGRRRHHRDHLVERQARSDPQTDQRPNLV